MKLWTYSELKSKVMKDVAIEDEQFVQPDELLGYFNEAIDNAEQEVLGIYEDYFLNRSDLTLVSGQEEYDLPDDIFAHKIRRIVFHKGTEIYQVKRLRDWKKFEQYFEINQYDTGAPYSYMLYNPAAGQAKILWVPAPRIDGPYATIWHIRNANTLAIDTDILDIPEAANFIMQYVKVRIYEKEGHISLQKAMADLERERDLLVSTLSAMVPDAQNEIEMDISSYEEMS